MSQIRKHGGNLNEASEMYNVPVEKMLDFSANINPLGPPQIVYEVIKDNLMLISRYPDGRNKEVKKVLANHLGMAQENIILGNGASELIFLIVNNIRPQQVWIPVPAFSEYEIAAESINAIIKHLPLQGESMDFFNLDKLSDLQENDIIFICNPNNPTGQLFDKLFLTELFKLCRHKGAYLIIDESFLDFLEDYHLISHMPQAVQNKNLLILYSLTKFFAIPGLRLGALIAHTSHINRLDRARDPWNINTFAQLAGEAALKDTNFIKETYNFFKKEREFLYISLKEIQGLVPFKPTANYIFIKLLPPNSSSELTEKLAKKGVLIRNCNSYPLLNEGFIRVAIKSHEDNLKLLANLKEVLITR
ncbi:MAG: threonine-phosphate decarboxylase CobD [Bacillota bacterium]